MTDIDHIIAFVRSLEKDHDPYGWPAIQMRDFSALAGEIERLRSDALKGQHDAKAGYESMLRDEFAKAAMQAIVSSINNEDMGYILVAKASWSAADAMMKERNRND
jgi:hypothetical protein